MAESKEARNKALVLNADIVRIEAGIIAEHWDVIQDEGVGTHGRAP
jgi:predicted SnoaL-like aldol condensation-catalyzing enzyme